MEDNKENGNSKLGHWGFLPLALLPAASGPVSDFVLAFNEIAKILAIVMITGLALLAALWVILSQKYKTATEKWAYSTVAAVLGYWLGAASF